LIRVLWEYFVKMWHFSKGFSSLRARVQALVVWGAIQRKGGSLED
jgi:hypothetical protein